MSIVRTIAARDPATAPAAAASWRRLGGVRRVAVELSPHAIEQIAQRVVQLLGHGASVSDATPGEPGELVSAGELARRLGVTRAWIYEHAAELSAVALGDGPRPRLRFDPKLAAHALKDRGKQPDTASPPSEGAYRARRRPPEVAVPLLPIRGRATRGIRIPMAIRTRGACS